MKALSFKNAENKKTTNKIILQTKFNEIEKYVPGEKVILKFAPRLSQGCKNGRIERATVIKIYKHYILFKIGQYKESVQKVDIATGEVKILKESESSKNERRKKKK